MGKPINNLADLKAVIRSLSPPKPGYKRVFRGQAHNYSKMLSSACRPNGTTKGLLWKLALMTLPEIIELNKNSDQSGIDSIMNFSIWFEALIQQYGPGSPYLDVTSSIDVALWFGLNEVELTNHDFWFYPTGHPKIPLQFPTLYFASNVGGSSWFYIIDVPIWKGETTPKHGELVDLMEGPEFVSSSTRVQRQKGALVYGDINITDGDLSSFYACDPIEISPPFTGSELADENFIYFFPQPEDDIWFEQLLKAPLVPHIDEKSGWIFKQSLEVYFVTDSPEMAKDFPAFDLQTEKLTMPIRAVIRTFPEFLKKIRETDPMNPEEATYIQIDVPLLSALPPINLWNQSALNYGLSKDTRPKLLNEDLKLPLATLENVILEFSPLDSAFNSDDDEDEPITALWLTIENDSYYCRYFFRDEGGFSFKSLALEFTYSTKDGQFEIKGDNNIPLITSGLPGGMIKYFFISLYVLRKLSPVIKPDPFCHMTLDKTCLLPMRTDSVTLIRSRKDPMDTRLHFLVNSNTGTRYEGPTFEHAAFTMLSIEPASVLPSLKTLREIYGHTTEISYLPDPLAFPVRQSPGFDAQIADYLLHLFSQYP